MGTFQAGLLHRFSPCRLLTLTTPGLPTCSGHLAWISVSLHQSKGLVRGSIASFSHLEGDPRITLKVHTSQFQEPPQAAGPGNGDPLPNRAQWSDLSGPPEMLWEECQTHKNKTQTQVVGEKEDLLH
jgi:hypothetical protein